MIFSYDSVVKLWKSWPQNSDTKEMLLEWRQWWVFGFFIIHRQILIAVVELFAIMYLLLIYLCKFVSPESGWELPTWYKEIQYWSSNHHSWSLKEYFVESVRIEAVSGLLFALQVREIFYLFNLILELSENSPFSIEFSMIMIRKLIYRCCLTGI